MTISVSELMQKEVININSGKRLGRITDISIDSSGKILSLKIVRKQPFMSKGIQESITIQWESIIKMNEDVILAKADDIADIPHETKMRSRNTALWSSVQNYVIIGILILSVIFIVKSCGV